MCESEREVLDREVQRIETIIERLEAIAACMPGPEALRFELTGLRTAANHIGGVSSRLKKV